MSTITAENVLQLIEQLPSVERTRLNTLLAQPPAEPVKTKPPRDKRVPCKPMPSDRLERQWMQEHKHEYPGQWVALTGDRLLAASPVQQEVLDAISLDGETVPLIARIPAPDDLPYIGI